MKLFQPSLSPVAYKRNIPIILALLVVVSVYQFYHSQLSFSTTYQDFKSSLPNLPELPHFSLPDWNNLPHITSPFHSTKPCPGSNFWKEFAPLLVAGKPKISRQEDEEAVKLTLKAPTQPRFHPGWETSQPKNRLEVSDQDVSALHKSHEIFLSSLCIPDEHLPKLEYTPGTRGIVTSAGGDYFPVLLVSLLMLRRTGSNLPVEVLVASEDEYEPLICETVLPALNATCIVLSRILLTSRAHSGLVITGYQLKIFAILFSTFEDLLFLDADNFPVHPPEILFDTKPYTNNNLVLWPDLWTPTFSPHLSSIIGVDAEIMQHRPTIEAGQILVSRKTHAKTLLLAAYYNMFGEFYFPLQTQGGPGQGDKETFAAAALVLNETLYTVAQMPSHLGTPGNGAAVLQADPIADYHLSSLVRSENDTSIAEPTSKPPPFFIHAGWPPKLNALHNFRSERQFGSEENSKALFGEDVEPIVWGYMVEMACEGMLEFESWGGGNKSDTGVCGQTRRSFRRMFGREYERGGGDWDARRVREGYP